MIQNSNVTLNNCFTITKLSISIKRLCSNIWRYTNIKIPLLVREVSNNIQSFTGMSARKDIATTSPTVRSGTDDAVGVPEAVRWYVAIVTSRHEKKISESLSQLSIENYVPVQSQVRVYGNGRRKRVEHVVIPCVVFIRCSERARREIVGLPYINRFMPNRSSGTAQGSGSPAAVIPEEEIARLKFMLGQSDIPVGFSDARISSGQKVRVIRGSLKGLEGRVLEIRPDRSELTIGLEFFGCARLSIDSTSLEVIEE